MRKRAACPQGLLSQTWVEIYLLKYLPLIVHTVKCKNKKCYSILNMISQILSLTYNYHFFTPFAIIYQYHTYNKRKHENQWNITIRQISSFNSFKGHLIRAILSRFLLLSMTVITFPYLVHCYTTFFPLTFLQIWQYNVLTFIWVRLACAMVVISDSDNSTSFIYVITCEDFYEITRITLHIYGISFGNPR